MVELERCRVYWGTHGCCLPHGHDDDCVCECALNPEEQDDVKNVGAAPYYGTGTRFYGEDVAARGLNS